MIRFDDSVAGEIDSILNSLWLDVLKVPPAAIRYFEQIVNQTYAVEERESRVLLFCAGLSLFLSCVGLYGLVSISMRTSTKEIGMRKVLGASTTQVISTFLRRFSMPVLLANVIACPVAIYFVLQWIERFPYQMDKGWLIPICLGTSVLVIMIAWLTVSALIWKAAKRLDIRPVAARRRPFGLPRRGGRPRRSGDPRGGLLEGAARAGRPRR
jgi:putative ABC transport system permease protein